MARTACHCTCKINRLTHPLAQQVKMHIHTINGQADLPWIHALKNLAKTLKIIE